MHQGALETLTPGAKCGKVMAWKGTVWRMHKIAYYLINRLGCHAVLPQGHISLNKTNCSGFL